MPTLKATLLLVLAAVTGAAAAPAGGTGIVYSCRPGDYLCSGYPNTSIRDHDALMTCNVQGEWILSAYCNIDCCRNETREGRKLAFCVC